LLMYGHDARTQDPGRSAGGGPFGRLARGLAGVFREFL
jgi:hypothetical protein